jgi:hypothetical protein
MSLNLLIDVQRRAPARTNRVVDTDTVAGDDAAPTPVMGHIKERGTARLHVAARQHATNVGRALLCLTMPIATDAAR